MNYGFLSTLPPIIMIILAFVVKDVVVALLVGLIVGILILSGGNPYTGSIMLFENIFQQIANEENAPIISIMVLVGGFVALIEKSGGAESFANRMAKIITSKAKAQIILWLAGIGIFFTDSGNSLILGPIFKPIYQRMGISKEKLAYILDSTSSPVCLLLPISGWFVFISGIIATEFERIGYAYDSVKAYIDTIPIQLYTISALILVPVIALVGKEFGPMAKFESEANKKYTEVVQVNQKKSKTESISNKALVAAIAPIFIFLGVLILMFISFGFPKETLGGFKTLVSINISYLSASIAAMVLLVTFKIMGFADVLKEYIGGMSKMMYILLVLVLSWGIGSACSELGTATYIVQATKGIVSPAFLPALMFIIGSLVSFSTGSSWGTFAILLPLAIPLANGLVAPMIPTISAVLCGGLFGDHCSPISDTTILSSMASGSDPVNHTITQLPYAVLCAFSSLIGYIILGFTNNSVLSLIITLVLMAGLYLGLASWSSRYKLTQQ